MDGFAGKDSCRFLLPGSPPRPLIPLRRDSLQSQSSPDFAGDGRANRHGLSSRYSETRPRSLDPPLLFLTRLNGYCSRRDATDLRAFGDCQDAYAYAPLIPLRQGPFRLETSQDCGLDGRASQQVITSPHKPVVRNALLARWVRPN